MAKKPLKPRDIVIGILILAAVAAWYRFGPKDEAGPDKGNKPAGTTANERSGGGSSTAGSTTKPTDEAKLLQAFRAKRSDVQVEVEGKVVFLFGPDRDGKPHQRFLVELPSGHTIKVAHNLTLSKSVPLKKGDTVRLYGEYEYNAKGGVVHWTHHDPRNRHPHGWIRHNGKLYR